MLATARHPITVWHEAGNVVEQSSSEIWSACADAVRSAMAEAKLPPSAVRGVGFDATCSLVVLDPGANPLTVSPSGEQRRNVIVWMDHRAVAEARAVNATPHDVLRYVGGAISPDGDPQAAWLRAAPAVLLHAGGHFLDLADFLSFGHRLRDALAVHAHCKWNLLALKDAGTRAISCGSGWARSRGAITRGSARGSGRRADRAAACDDGRP